MPLFSIIVPVFNDEKFLISAVNSVLCQNYSDYEVIIINDGSTDDSCSHAEKFSAEYPMVRVFHNDYNIGVAASRNIGLSMSEGLYVIFLDSDDMLIDDCLPGLAQLIELEHNTDLFVVRWIEEDGFRSNSQLFEDSSVLKSNSPTKLLEHINSIHYLPNECWHYVTKRKLLVEKKLNFKDVKVSEDLDFVAKLLCLVRSVAYFDHPFYWRRGTGRLCKSNDLKTTVGFVEIITSLSHFLINRSKLGIEEKRFILSRIKYASESLIARIAMHNETEISKIEKFLDRGVRRSYQLHCIFKELNLFYLIGSKRDENPLLRMKQEVEDKTVSVVDNVGHSKLYIWCAGLYALLIGSVMRQKGYQVIGFVDNNPALIGTTQNGFFVFGPEIFSAQTNQQNRHCIVIVCHPRVEVLEIIMSQLIQYGLKQKNIKHLWPFD